MGQQVSGGKYGPTRGESTETEGKNSYVASTGVKVEKKTVDGGVGGRKEKPKKKPNIISAERWHATGCGRTGGNGGC